MAVDSRASRAWVAAGWRVGCALAWGVLPADGRAFCLGAALARLEARCVLEALVPELPRFQRREREVEYVDSAIIRGPRRVELAPAVA